MIAFSEEPPGAHRALAFDLDRPARLADEAIFEELVGQFRQLDLPRFAVRLHSRRRVDRIAPDVEHELAPSDDSTDDRARIDADPEVEATQPGAAAFSGEFEHPEREPRDRLGVVGPRPRHARDAHPVVADRANLFHSVTIG